MKHKYVGLARENFPSVKIQKKIIYIPANFYVLSIGFMPNGKKILDFTLTSRFFISITRTFELSLGPMKAKKCQFLDCQRKNTTGNGILTC